MRIVHVEKNCSTENFCSTDNFCDKYDVQSSLCRIKISLDTSQVAQPTLPKASELGNCTLLGAITGHWGTLGAHWGHITAHCTLLGAITAPQ